MFRALVVLFLLLAAGCAGDAPPRGSKAIGLEGTNWVLLRVGPAVVTHVEGARPPNLRLAERRAGGFGGCNRFGGAYELIGPALRFGSMAATRMACASGGTLEQAYLDALTAVRGWQIAGSRLTLVSASGTALLDFEARATE